MTTNPSASPRRAAQAMELVRAAGPAGIDTKRIGAALGTSRAMTVRYMSEARATYGCIESLMRGGEPAVYFACKSWRDAAAAERFEALRPARDARARAARARARASSRRRWEMSKREVAEPEAPPEKKQEPTGPVVPHRTTPKWASVELPAGYVSPLDPTDCRAWARAAAA